MNRTGSGHMPQSIAPMLATAGPLPPDDGNWAFEFKWDGIRAVAFVEAGRARFASRNDNDLTGSIPELQPGEGALELPVVLDGEIVAFDETGVPRFQLLQNRGRQPNRPGGHRPGRSDRARAAGGGAGKSATGDAGSTGGAGGGAVAYIVFDVLWLGGNSLMARSYSERRQVLDTLDFGGLPAWTAAPSFPGPGDDVFAASRERGLEGVVAKRLDSRYTPGRRSPAWIKAKHQRMQEVVVGGWTRGEGSRSGTIGALLLGIPGAGGLTYVGKVGSGFDGRELKALGERFAPLVADRSPFSTPVPTADARIATWLDPTLVGEVVFSEWTDSGRLRQPVWRGLRLDKSPSEVTREA
jgi:bifunctional non-homologous end joining protein LigD